MRRRAPGHAWRVNKPLSRRNLIAAAAPAALLAGVAGRALSRENMQNTHSSTTSSRPVRPVDAVFSPPPVHWVGDGFRVAGYMNVIPDAAQRLSPFLLLDYHPPFAYEPSVRQRGVGVHPHRGFETVTLAWEGSVAHHDSTGAGGIIGPGDVQWMTAASGILHKEHHEAEFSRRGGVMHMAQLWVNLPGSHKMKRPGYQPITAADIHELSLPNGGGSVRVIAGELGGVKGPARTATKVNVFDARLAAGGKLELPIAGRENLSVLVMSGDIVVGAETAAKQGDFVLFKNEGELATLEAKSQAHLLVLGGEPIGEPVVQYGPFAMNTKQEIAQAYQDYRSGKFGYLED